MNKAEAERTLLKPPSAWLAYDYYVRAAEVFASYRASFRVEQLYDVRRHLEQSLLVDPNYARAIAMLSRTYDAAYAHPLDGDYVKLATLKRAHGLASRAIQLDQNLPQCHAQLGWCLHYMRYFDESIAEFERAIALNQNFTDWRFSGALVRAGDFIRAIQIAETHMRLDPFYPSYALYWLGSAFYMLKRYAEALPRLRDCVIRAPNFLGGHKQLAATYAQLGQLQQARTEAAEVLRVHPNFTINGVERDLATFKSSDDLEHHLDGLRKAGLPE